MCAWRSAAARAATTSGVGSIPPTGERFTMTGIAVHRVQDVKVVEYWHEIDILAGLSNPGTEGGVR